MSHRIFKAIATLLTCLSVQVFASTSSLETSIAITKHSLKPGILTTGAEIANAARELASAKQFTRELVFVDKDVAHYQVFSSDLNKGRDVLILDTEYDPIDQIAGHMKQYNGVDAIHIVSHGQPGSLLLAGEILNETRLHHYKKQLQIIGNSLNEGGDILLYGCNVAEGVKGSTFISALSAATSSDVAASTNKTGNSLFGGDWQLEASTGAIKTSVINKSDVDFPQILATTDLVGSSAWTSLQKGTNFDYVSDTQANKAGTEIVGDAVHTSLFFNYDTNNTTTGGNPAADDTLSIRIRIGDETKSTHSAFIMIGVDADGDDTLDAFISSGAGDTVIHDVGTDSNTSPNTSDIGSDAFTYAQTVSNYNFALVTAANDPDWDGNNNLDSVNGNTDTDVFVSFSIPVADFATHLATKGITFTQTTQLRLVSLTATQTNSLNSDFNGVDKSSVDDWTLTFAQLGIFSDPITSTGIVDTIPPAAPTVNSLTTTDTTPSITGTYPSTDAAGGFTVTVNSVTYTLGTDPELSTSGDNWTLVIPGGNALGDGTYEVLATVTDGASNSTSDASSNELAVDASASATTSLISASPASITADGATTSTVTVQLKNASGDNLVAGGDTVVLNTTSGSLSVVTDNNNGTYSATLTSPTTAGAATISGTVNAAALSDTAMVTFIAGPASPATSTISASPTSIPADGLTTSTITVQLKDVNGNNLTMGGDTVALATTAGSLGSVTDNNNGTYSATLTSSVIISVASISGTLNGGGNAIVDTASVAFTVGVASTATSTISATPASITADGASTSTVTVQLKDANGNNLTTGGDAVALATTAGTLGAVTDNNNGTYSATLTSSTAVETATINGTLNGAGNAIIDTASVVFTVGAASTATSTITATPASITADGASTSTIMVQLKDAHGNNLTTGGDAVALATTAGTLGAVTDNNNGTYSATLTSSTTVETATISGTLNGGGNTIVDSASVVFASTVASTATSTITATPTSITADGSSSSTITVQLQDASGNNLSTGGDTVALSTTAGSLGGVTDNNNGTYSATLTSSTSVETATISGTLNGAGNAIVDTASVAFTVGAASTATSTIMATPSSITADGSSISSITVQLKDASGTNLSTGGDTVTLATTAGSLGSITDNNNGTYSATLTSSTTVETATISGTLNGAGNAIANTASVNFTALADADGDGIPDADEGTGDTDGDGIPDFQDPDSDNDGIPDTTEQNIDSDNDGVPNYKDLDSDNDGVVDAVEGATDTDGDGIEDFLDLDTDNDGIPDITEAGGADTDGNGLVDNLTDANSDGLDDTIAAAPLPDTDSDTDGTPDRQELDSDNDGIRDLVEAGGADSNNDGLVDGFADGDTDGLDDTIATTPLPVGDTDQDGVPDYRDLDSDNDGLPDADEGTVDTDNDGVPDYLDLDSDNDGIPDLREAGGTDTDGNGIIDNPVDNNGDGLDDTIAAAPLADTDSDNDMIPDRRELDSDNDGLNDLVEAGGVDVNNDGLVDGFSDVDGNGYDDMLSATPLSPPDTDNDGIPDFQDNDDVDNDGIPDAVDLDADNDGIPDAIEGTNDSDNDGILDSRELDSDNDGLSDIIEAGGTDANADGKVDNQVDNNNDGLDDTLAASPLPDTDTDNDGLQDRRELDSDNDGIPDGTEGLTDTDGDGIPDYRDLDSDNDGIVDADEGIVDTDSDGVLDYQDLDSDNDGIPDITEAGGNDSDGDGKVDNPVDNNGDGLDDTIAGTPLADSDSDFDGTPDRQDLDSDNDGITDLVEAGGTDGNNDGMVDNFTDTNGDGRDDAIAAAPLTPPDTDGDGIPDFKEPPGIIETGLSGIGGGCSAANHTRIDPLLPIFILISSMYMLTRIRRARK